MPSASEGQGWPGERGRRPPGAGTRRSDAVDVNGCGSSGGVRPHLSSPGNERAAPRVAKKTTGRGRRGEEGSGDPEVASASSRKPGEGRGCVVGRAACSDKRGQRAEGRVHPPRAPGEKPRPPPAASPGPGPASAGGRGICHTRPTPSRLVRPAATFPDRLRLSARPGGPLPPPGPLLPPSPRGDDGSLHCFCGEIRRRDSWGQKAPTGFF